MNLGRPDFCGLAASFGIRAERVRSVSGYAAAVKQARELAEPCLVEVDLDAIGPMNVSYTGTSKPPQAELAQASDHPVHGVAAGVDLVYGHRQSRPEPEGPLAAAESDDVLLTPESG